nr:GW dipeptide domain-containing protein [Carnobacterium sp. ISL-102]
MIIAPTVKRIAVDGIYTIIATDNLNSIAEEFGVSLAQLAIWNDIAKDKINSINVGQKLAISKIGVESRLSATEKNKIYKESTTLFERQEFVDYIASYAVKIANISGEEPLYASVIIAQAIHESAYGSSGLSNPPNHNLTGIKGSYNGQYVKMWTWEHDEKFDADVSILANFRKYPSYFEALEDHGKKMRYGTTWNSKIYSGTWVNNTTSYKDATAALDGVYATDPYGYANKLNKYIEQYQLTDYDVYDSFLTKKKMNYTAMVLPNNEGIYTKPNGMKNPLLYTSYKYNNREVLVTEEATTQSGTFVKLVRLEDRGTIGWIKKVNIIIPDEFITKKNVNYDATVLAKNEGIYTKPKGMQGSILYTSYKYNNKEVKVGEEATTKSGTFIKLIRVEDRGTIGWIKKTSIKINHYDTFLTKKKVKYDGTVSPNNQGIYTKPNGMQGSILYTNYKYNSKEVEIGEEATTQNGTFAKLIEINSRRTIGWIKKADISKN